MATQTSTHAQRRSSSPQTQGNKQEQGTKKQIQTTNLTGVHAEIAQAIIDRLELKLTVIFTSKFDELESKLLALVPGQAQPDAPNQNDVTTLTNQMKMLLDKLNTKNGVEEPGKEPSRREPPQQSTSQPTRTMITSLDNQKPSTMLALEPEDNHPNNDNAQDGANADDYNDDSEVLHEIQETLSPTKEFSLFINQHCNTKRSKQKISLESSLRLPHAQFVAWKSYQVVKSSSAKSYTTFFGFAQGALKGVQEEHIAGKDFVDAIKKQMIVRRNNGNSIASKTAMLWNSLTRAFYTEAYGFKFQAKTGLFTVGSNPIPPKEVIPNDTLLEVIDHLKAKCPVIGAKSATAKEFQALQNLLFIRIMYQTGMRSNTLRPAVYENFSQAPKTKVYRLSVIDQKTSQIFYKNLPDDVAQLFLLYKRLHLCKRRFRKIVGAKAKVLKLTDFQLLTLPETQGQDVFGAKSFSGWRERFVGLSNQFPVLKEFLFTLHDIRRVRSRAVLKEGGEQAARDFLGHKGKSMKMSRLYAGEPILGMLPKSQKADQQVNQQADAPHPRQVTQPQNLSQDADASASASAPHTRQAIQQRNLPKDADASASVSAEFALPRITRSKQTTQSKDNKHGALKLQPKIAQRRKHKVEQKSNKKRVSRE